jgi:hypothetical protein
MRDVITRAESEYDLVLVDTPPTSVVSDAIPLVREVDGVIVVVRLGKSTREAVLHLRNQLENLNAPTLGVVVNALASEGGGYGYGYAYGYAYGETTNGKPATAAASPPVVAAPSGPAREPTAPAHAKTGRNGEASGPKARVPSSGPATATAVPSGKAPQRGWRQFVRSTLQNRPRD